MSGVGLAKAKAEARKAIMLCCNTIVTNCLMLNLYENQLSREFCRLCLHVPVYYDLILAMNMNSRADQNEASEQKIGVK
jgi:hypothetical protein